ncbi:MAG: 3-deoxy-manno-octulosonate-8-phosphatase KdsC [Gammaproteobacteria bacterium]|nr:3-deoxy-manno-octulosonate-8-phosphatase KdsC [Gammaproteobacteria bacterium]
MSNQQDLIKRAEKIRLVIFDVDGVLTDGGLYRGDDGQETKRFHSRDGLGMSLLRDSGVDIAFITGRTSNVVEHRAAELKIQHVYQGKREKLPAFEALCEELGIRHDEVAYMGDDLIDLSVLVRVGLALTVSDAHPEVIKRAHWVSHYPGGKGAAREACEMILQYQGRWDAILAKYLGSD